MANKRIKKKLRDNFQDCIFSQYIEVAISKARRHRIYLRTRTPQQREADRIICDNALTDLANLANGISKHSLEIEAFTKKEATEWID